MPDDITALREEVAVLRAELKELRLEHRKLLHMVGVLPLDDGEPWPDYLHIEASCVALRDDKMKIPVIMHGEGQHGYIAFMDENHRTRIEISTGENGPQIEMRNAEGKLIFQVAQAADGGGQLCVCDAEGRPRAGMRVTEIGGVVNVLDERSRALAFIGGTPEGGQVFTVNALQKVGVTIKATELGGVVSLFEPSGQLMSFIGGFNECGMLTIYGPQGAKAVSLGGGEDGGAIFFFNVDGESKSHLP